MQEREFWKFGERYFRKQRLDRYVEELSKAKDETVMAHKDAGVILGVHQSRMETHPRWYRETLFIQNGVYWLCCEGGPESRYECNDGRADNVPLEPEDALNWLETNGCEEQADTLLAIKKNGLLAVDERCKWTLTGGPRCFLKQGHEGPHMYKCAHPGCKGETWPASHMPHHRCVENYNFDTAPRDIFKDDDERGTYHK